ncbi:hypothetical protein [Streptomyces sp. NPDC008092]|uniref:hypothetical protein n=1 Tax=Streptomyces sp. NPDC008092 TaxID=3364808 RepID=UPI0036E90364
MPTSQQTATAYHWVMSIQTPDGLMTTRDAVIDVPEGVTRQQIFHFVATQFAEDYGQTFTILFFGLQPNTL